MLYTHTIGRIGKDCQVITGTHGTFMAVDIAVDDYSRGQNITTWVIRSSRENHVRLAEYLTKGRLILVEGTISTSQWKDRQGESHTQISINADSIDGGYHGYQYNCIVLGSGAEITCYRDEFEFVD